MTTAGSAPGPAGTAGPGDAPRFHAPLARHTAGLVVEHARVELRRTARSVQFVVGAIALPAVLYAMFGLPSAAASNVLVDGTHVGTMMMVSLCAYGVVSLAIFTFGEQLAEDRAIGWIRTMQVTPLPMASHLAAKVAVSVLGSLLVVASVGGLAVAAGNVRLDGGRWLALTGTLLLGLLAFSTFGAAIATSVPPRAATAVANLVFLPLAFLSGFFVPLAELPPVLRDIAVWLPTHHFGRLAWRQVAPTSGVEAWTGIASSAMLVDVVWVAVSAVGFGAVTVLAVRRAAITRRG